jgi:hypothetical protein
MTAYFLDLAQEGLSSLYGPQISTLSDYVYFYNYISKILFSLIKYIKIITKYQSENRIKKYHNPYRQDIA